MTREDIDKILEGAKNNGYFPNKYEIAFALLRDIVGNDTAAYLVFKTVPSDLPKFVNGSKMKFYRKKLNSLIGKGAKGSEPAIKEQTDDTTKEQNKAELLALIETAKKAVRNGEMDVKDALFMEKDIRVKLQDKFELEKSEDERRIIVVPQKNDIVCPHTHRECTYMPTKEACMEYYNLKEA